MESQTPCQEKETSLTTSQYDLSFKRFNEQWNRQQCKHLKWYSLGIWMTASGLGYKDTSFVLTNADFLSCTFPLPQLVRLCGEQAENASREEDKRTTELAYLLPAAARRCYFPAFSPASGSWASPVPYVSFPSSSPACTNSGTHWALHWSDLTHKALTKLLFFLGWQFST